MTRCDLTSWLSLLSNLVVWRHSLTLPQLKHFPGTENQQQQATRQVNQKRHKCKVNMKRMSIFCLRCLVTIMRMNWIMAAKLRCKYRVSRWMEKFIEESEAICDIESLKRDELIAVEIHINTSTTRCTWRELFEAHFAAIHWTFVRISPSHHPAANLWKLLFSFDFSISKKNFN